MGINNYKPMKVLVIYDSLYGNTEKIANVIGEKFSSYHNTKVIKVNNTNTHDIENVDLLIIGSPTHGGRFTEPIKKFIENLPKKNNYTIKAITFDTSFPTSNMGFFINHIVKIFGNAAPRLSKELNKREIKVIDSKIFYVLGKEGPLQEGEIERAKEWTDRIITLYH